MRASRHSVSARPHLYIATTSKKFSDVGKGRVCRRADAPQRPARPPGAAGWGLQTQDRPGRQRHAGRGRSPMSPSAPQAAAQRTRVKRALRGRGQRRHGRSARRASSSPGPAPRPRAPVRCPWVSRAVICSMLIPGQEQRNAQEQERARTQATAPRRKSTPPWRSGILRLDDVQCQWKIWNMCRCPEQGGREAGWNAASQSRSSPAARR